MAKSHFCLHCSSKAHGDDWDAVRTLGGGGGYTWGKRQERGKMEEMLSEGRSDDKQGRCTATINHMS